jgi:hypothetical protein
MMLVVVGVFAVAIATPQAEAAKARRVEITTESELQLFIEQAAVVADAISQEMQSEIFAARDDGKLKQVLKLEKKFDKRIRKVMGSYDKAVAMAFKKEVARAVKQYARNPPPATVTMMLLERASGRMDLIRDSLRTDLTTIVSESVAELSAG